jgi:uncharacterized DUF497 family protein
VAEPKLFQWNAEKNRLLQAERDISFEQVVLEIASGNVLDILEHPNKRKFPNQRIFVIRIRDYAWLVPFVESEKEIFLKTIVPSRKATRKYLGGKSEKE